MSQELHPLETEALIDCNHCCLGLLLRWLLRRINTVPERWKDSVEWEVLLRAFGPDLTLMCEKLFYDLEPRLLVRHARNIVLVYVTGGLK